MSTPLTESGREILRHALGSSHPDSPLGWRNYYCAPDGDADLEALVASGLMERGSALNNGRDRYYHCTEAGIDAAKEGYVPPKRGAWGDWREIKSARKEHACGSCGFTIGEGETYFHFVGKDDGRFISTRRCTRCYR